MRQRPVAAALVAVLVLALAGCATGAATAPATQDEPEATAPADARTLGAADAPVTVIEFTDLQCPYCAQFALRTWPEFRARYVDTGKVRFVSRDRPLSFHAHAVPAAVAARCAGEQGHYWDYREALFAAQPRLAAAPYDELARRFGLDLARFASCRANPDVAAAVRADAANAAQQGIASTPTFVVGRMVDGQFTGELIEGAVPLDAFAARVDALLQQAQQ